MAIRPVLVAVFVVACGARASTPPEPRGLAAREPSDSSTANPSVLADAPGDEDLAFLAWGSGNLGSAVANGCRALRSGGATRPAEVRRIVARAQLSLECPAAALETLGDDVDEQAVRLRVRAHAIAENWAAAGALAAAHADVFPRDLADHFTLLAAGGTLWNASGATCARVPLSSSNGVPTATISVDGDAVVAAVVSTEPYSLARPDAVPSHIAAEVVIGDVTIAAMPFLPADLAAWSARAGQRIDVVLGQDILLRWGVELDALPGRAASPELRLRLEMPRRGTFDRGEELLRIDGLVPAVSTSSSWPTGSGSAGYWRIALFAVDTTASGVDVTPEGRARLLAHAAAGPEATDGVGRFEVDGISVRMDELEELPSTPDGYGPPLPAVIGRIGGLPWMLLHRGTIYTYPGMAPSQDCVPDPNPWPSPETHGCESVACPDG